jgi:hypothetical protein
VTVDLANRCGGVDTEVRGVAVGSVVTLALPTFRLVSAEFVRWIRHPADPMMYAVNSLRELIASRYGSAFQVYLPGAIGTPRCSAILADRRVMPT